MADFYGFAEAEGFAGDGVGFAFVDVADVGDDGGCEVAAGGYVAEVVVELVGSGDEVGAAFEAGVHNDDSFQSFAGVIAYDTFQFGESLSGIKAVQGTLRHDFGDTDWPKESGGASDVNFEFDREHGAQFSDSGNCGQLRLIHLMITAKKGDNGARQRFIADRSRESHEGYALDVL